MKNGKTPLYKELAKFMHEFKESRNYKLEYIAQKTGVSFSSIGHYVNGRRKPKDEFVEKFIRAFNLTEKEKEKFKLAVALERTPKEIKEKLKMSKNIKEIDDEIIYIPIKAVASAGTGYLNFEEDVKRLAVRKNGFDKNCYLIEVCGNSMEPLIQDGSYIIVDPRQTEIMNNKIYVIQYDDETYIKKVVINNQLKAIILKSINPDYEDIYISGEDCENFFVRGRAIKFILEGKL